MDYCGLLELIDAERVPLAELANPRPGRRYAIRHDVDVNLIHAMRFARMEAHHGIRSSYFLLHTAPYFAHAALRDAVAELVDLGHEVGLHHDALTLIARRRGRSPHAILSKALERLRDRAPVVGASAHGGRLCYLRGFRNYQVWDQFDSERYEGGRARLRVDPIALSDLGLDYEAYFLAHDHYLSDSAGRWGSWINARPRPFERMRSRPGNPGLHVIDTFNGAVDGALQLLAHPIHWQLER